MRTSAGRLSTRGAFGAAVALILSACVSSNPYGFNNLGVELEPLAPGWLDDLRKTPAPVPVQFTWRDGDVSVQIANWPHEPTYFMVYVRNEGRSDVRMRIRRAADGDPAPGLGRFDVFGSRSSGVRQSGKVDERAWIALPAGGMVEFWIDGLDWLGDPVIGDRVSCVIDVERDGRTTTCPAAFRVARVVRQDR